MASVNIVFFGALKETIGLESHVVELEQGITIHELKVLLSSALAVPSLLEEQIKAAIDFEFARSSDLVDPVVVSEVAFFPPVTGG